jgi:HemY protein
VTRVFFWFLAFLGVALAVVWLADHPGQVTIDFQGLRFYPSFAELAALAAFLAFLAGALVWLVGWLRRDMPFFGSNSVIKRQARGLKMLNQSLVALSAGDHKLAGRLVGQAEVLLPPQPMVHLIAAEAAQRGGDHAGAKKRYAALEETSEGRLLGLRGLLSEAKRTGFDSEALRLARVAFEENRKSPWVLKTLFALEVAAGNWAEAEAALAKVLREGLLDKDIGARHRGALAYAEAAELNLKGDRAGARKGFKRALSLRPNFTPATVALARLDLSEGNKKRATKLVTEAWKADPHPGLARLFKELDVAESKADWLKRVRVLVAGRPDHPGSLLLLVDALMDAAQYEAVKPVLEKLTREAPSREAWQYRLALAHVLKEDPDPIEAALAHAEDGALWQCDDCGHKPKGWSPLCGHCSSFDTIVWRQKADLGTPASTFKPDTTIALLSEAV